MVTVQMTGNTSPITVTGLSAGQWTFQAVAQNGIGTGALSNSVSATVTSSNSSLPTTGPLYQRCSFGMYADLGNGGTSGDFVNLQSQICPGGTMRRFNFYQNMGTNGDAGWPAAQASWAAANNHDLDISWDCGSGGPTFASILSGGNNASLDAFFQQCKSFPHRVYLRMWWEMNDQGGPTKPGNGGLCANRAQWIQTWQYVYNRCKVTNGCTNVFFNYCPSGTDQNSLGNTMENTYPGSAYVDEVGCDAYNTPDWSPWQSFDSLFSGFYTRVTALHPTAPFTIGEVGCAPSSGGNSKATWMQGLFTSQNFPRMRNINFFTSNQGGNIDWSLTDDSAVKAICTQYLPSAPASGD